MLTPGSMQSVTALDPSSWSGEADTTHLLSTDPGVPPAASQSISHQSAAGTAQGTLPSQGSCSPRSSLTCQCLQLHSLERTVPLSCSSLSQMLQLPSLCLFPLASVLSTGIALGKGAGKVLKTYMTSKIVISARIATTQKFFSEVSTFCILCLSRERQAK